MGGGGDNGFSWSLGIWLEILDTVIQGVIFSSANEHNI